MWLLALACGPDAEVQRPEDPRHDAHEHAGHHGGDDATMHHRFDDAEQWSRVFDDPARDAWQKPTELVAALQLQPGQSVADIGAGTGYFDRHLAAAVGPTGRVIAIDIEPDMVAHMTERARQEATPQVEARLATPDDPKLAAGEVDLVLLVDTYHHVSDRVAYFGRLKAALRTGGRLAIVDFRPDGDPTIGPPLAHRLSPAQARDELGRAGWTALAAPDLLPQQYVLVFGL